MRILEKEDTYIIERVTKIKEINKKLEGGGSIMDNFKLNFEKTELEAEIVKIIMAIYN